MKFIGTNKAIDDRLENLESHLREEHPALLAIVPTYRMFDKVLHNTGLLDPGESLAVHITWWPLISVLGTFSSGKSTFINHHLGQKLQNTGNQAVDDKFTVICYGEDENNWVLPGTALDADPRFPFFGMSKEIEKVSPGEGKRIDSYLQLKTTSSPVVKGCTLIDSPGFDADDQRRTILRLTDHILDISDLVLVFFDARHPEPGAMQDTLQHLVASTIRRSDSGKFMYVLNQIDTTAREDNPEEVIAAWQRALSLAGLNSGRFFCIYNDEAAYPIDDKALRERYQKKRDVDLDEIKKRVSEVGVERGYRIISALESSVIGLEQDVIPALKQALNRWQQMTLIGDGVALAAVIGLIIYSGTERTMSIIDWILAQPLGIIIAPLLMGAAAFGLHYWMRGLMAKILARTLPERSGPLDLNMRTAFIKNTRIYRSIFRLNPVGWGSSSKRQLKEIREAIAGHVQVLNDTYTDPAGRGTDKKDT